MEENYVIYPIEDSILKEIIPEGEKIVISAVFKCRTHLNNLGVEHISQCIISESGVYFGILIYGNNFSPGFKDWTDLSIKKTEIKTGLMKHPNISLLTTEEEPKTLKLAENFETLCKKLKGEREKYWSTTVPNKKERKTKIEEYNRNLNSKGKQIYESILVNPDLSDVKKIIPNDEEVVESLVFNLIKEAGNTSQIIGVHVLFTAKGLAFFDSEGYNTLKMRYVGWRDVNFLKDDFRFKIKMWKYKFHYLFFSDYVNKDEYLQKSDDFWGRIQHLAEEGKKYWDENFRSNKEYKAEMKRING